MSLLEIIPFICGIGLLIGYIIVGAFGMGKIRESREAEKEDYAKQKVEEARQEWEKKSSTSLCPKGETP